MTNPRLRRLRADLQNLQNFDDRSPYVTILNMEGNPPHRYELELQVKGISKLSGNKPIYSYKHNLIIDLHNDYPRKGPAMVFRPNTPIFHPNIAQNGVVCIGDEGDHGWAPSMGIVDLVLRIIDIVRYKNFNPNSALNDSAARWSVQNKHLFPLEDKQIITERELEINLIDDDLGDLDITFIDDDSGDLDIKIF